MKGHEFLRSDYPKALAEHHCIYYCLEHAKEMVISGEIEEVQLLMRDIEKSAITIQKMRLRKKEMDNIHLLIEKLKSFGIDVEVIKRTSGGRFE